MRCRSLNAPLIQAVFRSSVIADPDAKTVSASHEKCPVPAGIGRADGENSPAFPNQSYAVIYTRPAEPHG